MPEPVTCHASVIQCDELTIGPMPPEPQQTEPPDPGAGARALVESHTPPLVVKEMPHMSKAIDTPVGALVRNCLPETLAGGLVAAAVARVHPAVSALAAFKATWDLVECVHDTISEAQARADRQLGADACRNAGGTPFEGVDGRVLCATPEPEPSP
jgi:hypothetical protein